MQQRRAIPTAQCIALRRVSALKTAVSLGNPSSASGVSADAADSSGGLYGCLLRRSSGDQEARNSHEEASTPQAIEYVLEPDDQGRRRFLTNLLDARESGRNFEERRIERARRELGHFHLVDRVAFGGPEADGIPALRL